MDLLGLIRRLESLAFPGFHTQREFNKFHEEFDELIPSGVSSILKPDHYSLPLRWGEVLPTYFMTTYKKLMEPSDTQIGLHGSVSTDPVYQAVGNPQIRKRLEQRRMKEDEYCKIADAINNFEMALPVSTRAVVQISTSVTAYDLDRRLATLPLNLLAIESGLSEASVAKYQGMGWKATQIVDLGFALKEQKTTSSKVREMTDVGIQDWPGVIESARHCGCTIRYIIDLIRDTGITEAELLGLLDDAEYITRAFSNQYKRNRAVAWWLFFEIFRGRGKLDINRSIDMFIGSYPEIDIESSLLIDFFEAEDDT